MSQPVERRGGELLVAREDGHPLRKRQIRRHHRGASFVTIRDQIRDQIAADPIEGDEAELADEAYFHAPQPLLEPHELAGLEELAYEVDGARDEDAAFLLGGFDAECDRQMRLPRAGGTARIRFSGCGDQP